MINQKIYKQLNRGLEQYLWYLGQDTKDPKNNLLRQYGFHRYRISGHGGSSRYKIKRGSKMVDLHSFCVGIYGKNKESFLFVRAHDQSYLYLGKKAPLPGRYRKTFLVRPVKRETKERFFIASCEFLEWLEDYETWVEKNYGKGYRIGCYKRYSSKWLSPAKARKWFQKYRKLGSNNGKGPELTK